MNYLAHLFLAGETAESLIGNLAGDFVKGPLHERFSPEIRQGIMEHRRIDAFTDSHPSVAAFRRVLIPEHGHWSRVIADVFFDHFVACDFESYAGEPLETFVDRAHRTIDQHVDLLPDRLRTVWPYMRDQRWLVSYREVDGIELALRGLSRRIARHPPLFEAVHHLEDSREELLRRFRAFFPDVISLSPRSNVFRAANVFGERVQGEGQWSRVMVAPHPAPSPRGSLTAQIDIADGERERKEKD